MADERGTGGIAVSRGAGERSDGAPELSVIVIAERATPHLDEALNAIRRIEGITWEVVCVLNEPHRNDDERIHCIASGRMSPGRKRDLGASHARAPVIAFLDDDAYPSAGWAAAALERFGESSVWAVGGPGVTPPQDGFWQQVSGWVYGSALVSGPARHRYVPTSAQDVDDYPSMNLFVRARVFAEVGGFNSEYYPGEDTKLCLDITQRGGRIMYEPRALVYHHRRALFPGHFRQIAAYGFHRGLFAKRFPETSFRLHYFVPSIWTVWLLAGWWLRARSAGAARIYRAGTIAYAAACALAGAEAGLRSGSARTGVAVAAAIAATHLVYGIAFVRGLLARDA